MRQLTSAVLVALGLGLGAAYGATEAPVAPNAAEAGEQLATGEVRKVDKAAGKVTIKHGPLPNLDMPGMVMVFRVKDPAWLDQMKPGDKIRFVAERVNGLLTVVRYEPGN